jgi:hypothetical protein
MSDICNVRRIVEYGKQIDKWIVNFALMSQGAGQEAFISAVLNGHQWQNTVIKQFFSGG